MLRRDFIKLSGTFLAGASLPGLISACYYNNNSDPSLTFPQGIASGDPRPSSIAIWTRVAPSNSTISSTNVTAEVALDEDFTTLVLQQNFLVTEQSDFTIRVIVQALEADTFYYYRFIAATEVISRTGRTLTAPLNTDAQDIHFAFVNCQNLRHGFYSAYRRMINDDLLVDDNKKIRFVLHLGDFIYETLNDSLQDPIDAQLNPIRNGLQDRNGNIRAISSFPDGATTPDGTVYANTVEDYRYLYKEYLKDPDLQEARARWPFIHIWDDHEFSDDCWQSEANYIDSGTRSSTNEPSQPRKVAANQAWFEYMPVNLLHLDDVDADLRHSKEYSFTAVDSSSNLIINDQNLASNSDNLAAIDSMTIYRSFRYGRLIELILTDNRSYRSDHAIPEDITGNQPGFLHPRMVMPINLVNELDAGNTANNGDPDIFIVAGGIVTNPRYSSPPGSILGSKQKQWWKDTLGRTDAQWKLWGNSVPLLRLLVNTSALDLGIPDVVLSTDAWDGYAQERNELMNYLIQNDISNVISLSGDVHAHLAGVVMNNYDDSAQQSAMLEFVSAAISSVPMFAAVEKFTRRENPIPFEQQLRKLITYDSRKTDVVGDNPFVNNLNNTLLNGTASGLAAAQSNNMAAINAAKDPSVNSHLRFIDTNAHGYGIVAVTTNDLTIKLITIDNITTDPGTLGVAIKSMATFIINPTRQGDEPAIAEPVITGTPPFPL